MAGKSYFKGNLSEEELKKKLAQASNDFRKNMSKNMTGSIAEGEMKFITEMAPSVDEEMFKKIKALIK